jgi:hypothetical protein
VAGTLNGVTAAVGLEDERVSHVTDGRIVRHARSRFPVLVPCHHVSVTSGEQHDRSEAFVGDGAVDRGGNAGIVCHRTAPAPVLVKLAGTVDQSDRVLPPVEQIRRADMPPLDPGVNGGVRVVLEEQVVATIYERAAVRIVHPSVRRATMQVGESRIRMRGIHLFVLAPSR